jgi:hypothetical protein
MSVHLGSGSFGLDHQLLPERLFTFPTIDSLNDDEAAEALIVPATVEGVDWNADAVVRLYELPQGYPYFIQEFGRQARVGPSRRGLSDHCPWP